MKHFNVTIKDVAKLAGVSPMTVSRVINGSIRVSPDPQRRVAQGISQLGFVPRIGRAAEEVARRSTYRVILCDTRADLAVERDVVEELIAHRVEGIAIAPVSDQSKPHLATPVCS